MTIAVCLFLTFGVHGSRFRIPDGLWEARGSSVQIGSAWEGKWGLFKTGREGLFCMFTLLFSVSQVYFLPQQNVAIILTRREVEQFYQ